MPLQFGGGGDTTKPSQRVNKSFEELQLWKRHLVATDKQLKGYVASTEQLAGMLDEVVAAFPRMYTHTALSKNEAALGDEWAALPAPRDRDRGARPSAAVIKKLSETLSRDVHVPVDQWHKRYGELRETIAKELDAARKQYDLSSAELVKIKKKQAAEEKKQHMTQVEALETVVQEKVRLRQESWNAYFDKEAMVYETAKTLSRDAYQAYNWLSKATSAVSMAMSELAHHYASRSSGQFVVPTPPQLPMQQLTLDNGPSKPGPPPRNPSWTGSQARVGYGAPVSSPPSAAPSARVSPSAGSGRYGEYQRQGSTASEYYQPQSSNNSETKHPAPSSNTSESRYSNDDVEYGDDTAPRAAPGQAPPAHAGSGGISAAHRAAQAAGVNAYNGQPSAPGAYVIGTYNAPLTGAAARPPAAPWHQAPRQSGGAATPVVGYTSPTGYTRPNNLARHTATKSGASDISLSAAAGGVPSPGSHGRHPSGISESEATTRVHLPHTPASVDGSMEDEETPAAEKGYASPFRRQFVRG